MNCRQSLRIMPRSGYDNNLGQVTHRSGHCDVSFVAIAGFVVTTIVCATALGFSVHTNMTLTQQPQHEFDILALPALLADRNSVHRPTVNWVTIYTPEPDSHAMTMRVTGLTSMNASYLEIDTTYDSQLLTLTVCVEHGSCSIPGIYAATDNDDAAEKLAFIAGSELPSTNQYERRQLKPLYFGRGKKRFYICLFCGRHPGSCKYRLSSDSWKCTRIVGIGWDVDKR